MTVAPSPGFPSFPASISSSLNLSSAVSLSTPDTARPKDSEQDGNPSKSLTLFIGNIHQDVSNECMEKILKQCGSLLKWKRIKGTGDQYQAFGFCDFKDEASTLCALRILEGFELHGKKLVVNAEDDLHKRLMNWASGLLKANGKPDRSASDISVPVVEDGKKTDKEKMEKITSIILKYQNMAPSDEERKKKKHKSHSKGRKRGRSASSSSSTTDEYDKHELKQIYKKKHAKYHYSVKLWEKREEKQARHYEKLEKHEKHRYSKREEEKLKRFLASYDDKTDDLEWYSGKEYKHRRKHYERERQWDYEDRLAEKAEMEMQAKMAEESALKANNADSTDGVAKTEIATDEQQSGQWTVADIKKEETENDVKPFNPIPNVLSSGSQSITQKLINVFGSIEEEDVDVLLTRTRLKPFEISSEERLAHMTEEEKRKKLKELLQNLPKHKDELFVISVDRSQIDDTWIDKRVRPWVMKRILEFIGEEEKSFCDFICDKIAKESDPYVILNDIKLILDEDAEVFMVKLWRLIIFETEAKKYGVPLPH